MNTTTAITGQICPCCNRRVPAVKGTSKAAKKLSEDTQRAEAATRACERAMTWGDYPTDSTFNWGLPNTSLVFIEACRDEVKRLRRAIAEPRILWAIYRRKDTGESYVVA